ncbi:MAG: Spore protein SP21 [Nitrospira sp.]|nr:Spore protein SP21 [Nitrospira sp.]
MMTLTRWNPNREGYALFRAFDDVFGTRNAGRPVVDESATRRYALPVDIYETADDLVIKAHLPGVDAAKTQINIEDGQLTIQAHIPSEVEKDEAKEYRWHTRQTWFGDVVRTISLPTRVDAAQAKADFKDGVLTLVLPKAAEAKPRQIPVTVS